MIEELKVIAIVDASAEDTCWRIVEGFSDRLNMRAERRPDLVSQMAKINFGVEQARANWI